MKKIRSYLFNFFDKIFNFPNFIFKFKDSYKKLINNDYLLIENKNFDFVRKLVISKYHFDYLKIIKKKKRYHKKK